MIYYDPGFEAPTVSENEQESEAEIDESVSAAQTRNLHSLSTYACPSHSILRAKP